MKRNGIRAGVVFGCGSSSPMSGSDATQPGPLAGIRVLDLSRLVAGNMLSLQLADFGADVIKLEPGKGDPLRHWQESGLSIWWKVYSRNKRSIRLDLRSDKGKNLLARLVPDAQVLIEGFRPGTMEAAGFGPDALLALNPKLVIVRISGFGQTGPYAQRPGFGSLIEAMSGFAAKNGFADKPPALPNLALADMVAGLSGAFDPRGAPGRRAAGRPRAGCRPVAAGTLARDAGSGRRHPPVDGPLALSHRQPGQHHRAPKRVPDPRRRVDRLVCLYAGHGSPAVRRHRPARHD